MHNACLKRYHIGKNRIVHRNPEYSTSVRIEQPLDLSIPENKIMLAFYWQHRKVENDGRAMKEGRPVNMAPKGYKNARDENNIPIIIPSKDVPLIAWSFEDVAKGVHTIIEV